MISINGKRISIGGNSVTITNGKVYVDGKRVDEDIEDKVINITIEGNVERLDVDACDSLLVKGSANSIKTISGDVNCGDIAGSVSTVSGDVNAKIINGSTSTVSGDISC